jgi:hypothetical protein
LAESLLAGKRLLHVEAIGSAGSQVQMKAQLDNESGMLEQKATKLTGVEETFADAHHKGFEIGAFGMGWSATRRALVLPVLDEGPIQQGKKGAIVLDDGVMGQQSSQSRLVKQVRCRYHSLGLLLCEYDLV